MLVTCINDKNLPEGAHLEEGAEYTVVKDFINSYGQRTYLLKEVPNGGRTSKGLRWWGYDAVRFRKTEGELVSEEAYNYALN